MNLGEDYVYYETDRFYYGRVMSVLKNPEGAFAGKAIVDVDKQVRIAHVTRGAKGLKEGHTVMMKKQGASFTVLEIVTPPDPPVVNPTMGTKPPSAATTSGSTSVPSGSAPTVSGSINNYTVSMASPIATPSSYTKAWADSLIATVADMKEAITAYRQMLGQARELILDLQAAHNTTAARVNGLRDAASSINSNLSSTQQAVNTNASRLNQTVDYASGAADAMGGIVDALKEERIVR